MTQQTLLEIVNESGSIWIVGAVELSGCLEAKERSVVLWKASLGSSENQTPAKMSEWAAKGVASPNGDGVTKQKIRIESDRKENGVKSGIKEGGESSRRDRRRD